MELVFALCFGSVVLLLVLRVDSPTVALSALATTRAQAMYIQAHTVPEDFQSTDNKLRFMEGIVEAGERVAVLGHGSQRPDPGGAGTYREMPTRLLLHGNAELPLMLTDQVAPLP